jgi:MFS family permease
MKPSQARTEVALIVGAGRFKLLFTAGDRGLALGLFSASSGLGQAAGPVLAGALLDRFWWGSVFLVNVPVVPEPAARQMDETGVKPR